MVVHADCSCSDWPALLRAHQAAYRQVEHLGVWAPRIEGTPYAPDLCRLECLDDSPLQVVVLTDGIVFALSPRLVERMRRVSYGANPLGWGIDLLFCAAAFAMGELVVVDDSATVFHPPSRGYDSAAAKAGAQQFLRQQLSAGERIQLRLLESFWRFRRLVFRAQQVPAETDNDTGT
jgi:hypothetical protein